MESSLQFTLALALILFAAKAGSYVSTRIGQPAVLGMLVTGLILGPSGLNVLHSPLFSDSELQPTLQHLAHLGVLFLMFIAGLEVHLPEMKRSGKPAVFAGVLGVVAPVLLGVALGYYFGLDVTVSLFIGLVLAATSVSISAQTLMEIRVLRSRVGMALLGAAVVDDVLVVLLLAIFIAVTAVGGASAPALLLVLVKMVTFLGVATWFGARLFPRMAYAVAGLGINQGVMSLAIVTTLMYGWAAEALGGVAAITGAFLAGVLFQGTALRDQIDAGLHALAYAWLVPIFFMSIGLQANIWTIGLEGLPFAMAMVLVAVVSKVIGCGLGGRLGGLSTGESFRLGIGMTSRGEVGLIVASIGLGAGLITSVVFASVIVMVLVTTLLTPVLLRAVYPLHLVDEQVEGKKVAV